jgi:hypothetical protein
MKKAAKFYALFCCLWVAQGAVAVQGGLVEREAREDSPLVRSVVNNFKGLLKDSTIIVLDTAGNERGELAKVEAFLKGKKGTVSADQIVESIRKQYRRDKTGFAYPIWLTSDSASGNACVLAVNENSRPSYESIVSKKIDGPLIVGSRLRPIDGEIIQASVVAHEMYHCYEYLSGSMTDFVNKSMQRSNAYQTYRSESAADAFAALYVRKNFDDLNTIRMQMEFRRIGMLNSDVEHNTSPTVERVLKSFNKDQLSKMRPDGLVIMAGGIRDDSVLDEKDFVALKKSSIEITRAYLGLLSGLAGVDVKKAKTQLLVEASMLMDDSPEDGRLNARVFDEITASLYKIGAGRAVSSKYFQPLVEQFHLETNPKPGYTTYTTRTF